MNLLYVQRCYMFATHSLHVRLVSVMEARGIEAVTEKQRCTKGGIIVVERVAILVDAYTTTMIKNEIMGLLLAW